MSKYREQVFRLLMASKRDDPAIVTQLKEQHTNVSPQAQCGQTYVRFWTCSIYASRRIRSVLCQHAVCVCVLSRRCRRT